MLSINIYIYFINYNNLICFTDNCDYRLSLNVIRKGQAVPIRSALRTSYIILILIGLFMASWTPYAVVTFVGQFGDNTTPIKPWISALPALCAKVKVTIFFITFILLTIIY